jgi:Tfp pilus assembly protein PilZ
MSSVRHVLSPGVRIEIRSPGRPGVIYGDVRLVTSGMVAVRVLERAEQLSGLRGGPPVSVIAKCPKETLELLCAVLAEDEASVILGLPSCVKVIRGTMQYRRRTWLAARCATQAAPRETSEAIVTDLSVGGMQLQVQHEHKIGTRLLVEFSLPDDPRAVKIEGEVVRIIPHGPEGFGPKPRIGVRFVEIGRLDMARLKAFLETTGAPEITAVRDIAGRTEAA